MPRGSKEIIKTSLYSIVIIAQSLYSCTIKAESTVVTVPGIALEAGKALIPSIVASFGSASITLDLYKYRYTTTTKYRGVDSSTSWIAEIDASGSQKFRKILIMTGVDNPLNTTNTTPFSISFGGSDGDIPFCVRQHRCDLISQNFDLFTSTTEALITFRIAHKYTSNPAMMSYYTSASINCIGWNLERKSCEPVTGKVNESIPAIVANNGISYATIPNGKLLNISHGLNSGIGITW